MSLYLRGFQDRNVNVSKRRINVSEKQEYADGKMMLIANISRSDTGVSSEGTRLDANSINNAVLDLIYYELYGLDSDIEGYSVESDLIDVVKYNVYFNGRRFYGYAQDNPYFDISVQNEANRLRILIEKKNTFNLDYATNIPFYIDLYADSDVNFFVCRYKGNISYVPSSTSPND